MTTLADNKQSKKPAGFVILHEFPTPEIEALWREFLTRAEFPAHYDTPEFFLEPYWSGQNPFAILAFDNAKVVGVLTGLHHDAEVVSGLQSRPQLCLDPKANAFVTSEILAEGLLHEAGRAKLITVYTWATTPLPAFPQRGYRFRELEGDVVLDLKVGAEALFANFAKNRRRDVRLAIRNGISVSEAITDEDLRAYWEVYSAWRKTERKRIHHDRSFAAVEKVHHMRGNHRRFLARYEGKVVAAAGVRFYSGSVIEYANNCSLDEFMKLLPNDLLFWRTIEWACRHGFKRYSLGGAHPFLRKWGGTVVPVYRYRLDRTIFRRHDMKENLADVARKLLRRMPTSWQGKIRKVLKK